MEQISSGKAAKRPDQPPVSSRAAKIKDHLNHLNHLKGSGRVIPPIGAYYRQSPDDMIALVRQGVPADRLIEIGACLHRSKEWLFRALKLPRSTMDHKIRQHERLSPEHSERVVGLERLIGQVQAMIEDSDATSDFDVGRWVGQWLDCPVSALGGAKPADLMDTLQGQALVSRLLAQSQAGVFA